MISRITEISGYLASADEPTGVEERDLYGLYNTDTAALLSEIAALWDRFVAATKEDGSDFESVAALWRQTKDYLTAWNQVGEELWGRTEPYGNNYLPAGMVAEWEQWRVDGEAIIVDLTQIKHTILRRVGGTTAVAGGGFGWLFALGLGVALVYGGRKS